MVSGNESFATNHKFVRMEMEYTVLDTVPKSQSGNTQNNKTNKEVVQPKDVIIKAVPKARRQVKPIIVKPNIDAIKPVRPIIKPKIKVPLRVKVKI